jgi:hypothetical protein
LIYAHPVSISAPQTKMLPCSARQESYIRN